MSSRLLIFAVSAAAIGIGTLLWFYWQRKQKKDESNSIHHTLQLGEVVDPQIMAAEVMEEDSKLKECRLGNYPVFLNDMIPSYEEIPSDIFLTSVSDDTGLIQNKSISNSSVSENDFVLFPTTNTIPLFTTCCSSPHTPSRSPRVISVENDCVNETKAASCEPFSNKGGSNNDESNNAQVANLDISNLLHEDALLEINQVKEIVVETQEFVTEENLVIMERSLIDELGVPMNSVEDVESLIISSQTTFNGDVDVSNSNMSPPITKTNETILGISPNVKIIDTETTQSIDDDAQIDDYFSATDNEEHQTKVSSLPEKLSLLTKCDLTCLTEEEAAALRDCLSGFGLIRLKDEDARKDYDRILVWILQATAFTPNLRLFISNGLTTSLIKQLSENLHEDQLPEKSTVTIIQILVNLLPQMLTQSPLNVDQEALFWAQLKDCINVVCSREFHPYSNPATLISTHNVHNNVQLQMACLQLLSNLSLLITDPQYQTSILDIMMPHLSWLFICAYSWNSSNESHVQYASKIRGLCLSCLLHVSIPITKSVDNMDIPFEISFRACHALHSIKVSSNASTCINRELNNHRFHELKEKWLRLIVNVLESAAICKDVPEFQTNDTNDMSATLLSCITDSSLSLQATMFLLASGSTSPEIKEMAERATALLGDASFTRN